jgi:MarR family 2-MHQ and catechol resistance regulon transcriptional repressor
MAMSKEGTTNKADNKHVSLDLFIVLSRAYKSLMDHAVRDIRRYNLNPTEFAVLELLYHKGSHPLQQIGDKILLASGSITYVVDKLEQKGFLERHPCPKDRRITYALISDQGKEMFDQIFPQHIKAIKKAVEGLTEQEQEVATQLLKKLGIDARKKLD